MIKMGYDAGHGLHTPGKRTPDDEREWTFNNTVATAFAGELAKYDGIELKRFDDPTGQKDIVLNDRTKAVNAWGADYHISFHHNANTAKWGTWTGVETFMYLYPSIKQINLANAIHGALVQGYGLRDRGIKKEDWAICRDIKKSGERVGILLEGGFMDSTIDIKVLRDKDKLENAGRLIAQAVAKHFNLKLKVTEVKNMLQISRETMRKAAITEIKAAVEDGRFTSKHEDVEKYDDETLQNFFLVALERRK